MKTRALLTLLTWCLSTFTVHAQTDVTNLYLKNAAFDSGFNYSVSDAGNVAQEILDVGNWTKDFTVDYTITGVYQYGTSKTFNGASVPSSGYGGASGGGLALSTGWGVALKFNQEVTLPEGKYAIVTAFYNSHTATQGKSLVGWLPAGDAEVLSSLSSFPSKKWVADTLYFTVLGETTGKIQIGLQSVGGAGSGSTAKVLLDFVRILSYGLDKTELETLLSEAVTIYGDGQGKEATALKTVIDAAMLVKEDSNAKMKAIAQATEELRSAIWAYKLINSSMQNPLDFTSSIKNPSFESDGLSNWINSGMRIQTNTGFAQKDGTAYVEKYVNKGLKVGSANVEQIITDIPNGRYLLKVSAQNIQQNVPTALQTGACIFADEKITVIGPAADYSVEFTVITNKVTLGFRAENATGNWLSCDNFRLYRIGGDLTDIKAELQKWIDRANGLISQKMQASVLVELNASIEAAQTGLSVASDMEITTVAMRLQKAVSEAEISIEAYLNLQAAIDEALIAYGEGDKNGAADFNAVIESARLAVENLNISPDELNKCVADLKKAAFAYLLANGTGTVPQVVTNPSYARGSTMAFGRSTISGVTVSQLAEQGFCWSTSPNPTILDNRTTKYFSHNGYIYHIENLEPSTVYYMRAYAMTKTNAVGYGEVIKVITLPKGTITYSVGESATGDNRIRITEALGSAVDYWNNLTSIQGHHVSVGWKDAEGAWGSYGGGITLGNVTYQRIGTIMHEMDHTIGVGQHGIWKDSPLKASGGSYWQGERAAKVVCFLENNPNFKIYGDGTHMWPKDITGGATPLTYGFNGPWEDPGDVLVYIGNALITQALGEDGLPPTGGFTTPAYTFESEENVKYYMKNEDKNRGRNTSFLVENAAGQLFWKETRTADEALNNDSAAWYVDFNPKNCYYQIRNVATGKFFTYNSNRIGLVSKDTPGEAENFQLTGSRVNTEVGKGASAFITKGYWMVRPEKTLNPPCLVAKSKGETAVATFNLSDEATVQRWLMLTADEVTAFEAATEQEDEVVVSDLKINGETVPGFSYELDDYSIPVNPESEASSYIISAEKALQYEGILDITQTSTIPGIATVKAIGRNGVDKIYTIRFVKNYVYRWDGNGAAGTGSEPSSFGWSATPSVTWGIANSSANRYVDPGNGQYTNYTYEGEAYDKKRMLWIRYNNSEEFTYDFNGLKYGAYKLSLKYGWHNNGVAPKLTIGVYEKSAKKLIAQSTFTSSNMTRNLKAGEFTFNIPANMSSCDYYISIKNNANSDCMAVIADLAVIDNGVITALPEIVKGNETLTVINGDGGIWISCDTHSAENIKIYSGTGQLIRNINVGADPLFVSLSPGVYIVGSQKIRVE